MIKGFNINGNIEKIDYESLENKPFYSEIVTGVNRDIIPSQEVEFVDFGVDGFSLAQILLDSIDVVEGGQYNLKIDEQECPIVIAAHTDIGLPGFELFCGNLSLLNSVLGVNLADTGENYCGFFGISEGSPCLGIIYQTTTPIHTIELSYAGDVAPIITEGTYTFNEQGQDGISICDWNSVVNANFIFQEGDMFNLIFDGQTYENITCRTIEGDCYLGSAGVLGVPDGAEENYCITTYNDHNESTISILTSLPVGDYKVSLERVLPSTTTEIVHKIDSKYLDMDIPYTEDGEGNIVFENDVYINGSTSVLDIEENLIKTKRNVFNLQTETNTIKTNVSTLQGNVSTLQGDVGVIQGDISGLKGISHSKQLVEGLFGGFSTCANVIPTGENAWIEGQPDPTNCFDNVKTDFGFPMLREPCLSVTQTTVDKETITKAVIVLTPDNPSDISAIIAKLEEYPYLAIKFAAAIEEGGYLTNLLYYVSISSLSPTDSTIEISFAFVSGQRTFPIDTPINRRIEKLLALPNVGGNYSHSEGYYTTASGSCSHAEGGGTIASGDYSHVQGRNNIEDTEGKYAHIVGNGGNRSNRSNAHTVDWKGNAWYAGEIYIGGTKQDEGKQLATQEYVMAAINGSLDEIAAMIDESGVLDE